MIRKNLYIRPCEKCIVKSMCNKRGSSACNSYKKWKYHRDNWNLLKRNGNRVFFYRSRYDTSDGNISVTFAANRGSIYDVLKRNDDKDINKISLENHHKYVKKLFIMFYIKNSKIKSKNIEIIKGFLEKNFFKIRIK